MINEYRSIQARDNGKSIQESFWRKDGFADGLSGYCGVREKVEAMKTPKVLGLANTNWRTQESSDFSKKVYKCRI